MKKLILMLTATLALAIGARAESDMDTLRVYFDPNQNEVTEFQQSLIDIFLKTHYSLGEMVVAGHADATGDELGNLERSRERARIVANYLLAKGISPSKMRLEIWGETDPIVPNTTPANRTRNRRVEIIGIPYMNRKITVTGAPSEEIVLADGSIVPIRDMTADGKPRRVFTIVLRKGPQWFSLPSTTFPARNPICGFRETEMPCPYRPDDFRMKLAVAENLRCPADQIQLKDRRGNALTTEKHDLYFVYTPEAVDSGFAFLIPVSGTKTCDSIYSWQGEGCYTIHPAKITFEDKLKVDFLRGKSAPMREGQTAKRQPDGSYLLHYTNDEPGNLRLTGVVVKGKRKKVTLQNVSLDQLNYNDLNGTYEVTKRNLKRLRKH